MKYQLSLFSALLPLSIFLACSEGSDDPAGDGDAGDGDGDMGGESSGDGDGDMTGDGDGDVAGDGGGSGDGDGDGAGTGGFAPMLPNDVSTPKIMIVGDSISAGPGCYKKYLAEHLTDAGHSFEFVGEYTDDCGGDVLHSAVSCTTSGQFAQETFTVPNCFSGEEFPGMTPLMQTHEPDVVMIQLGVNDVWGGGGSITTILNNYATLVEQARAENANVLVFVAQIHQIITDNCMNENSTAKAQELVDAVPAWAAEISTEESPVVPADLWTNSDPMEAGDCVHPDDAGARRMAENWYEAMKDIIP